MRVLITAGPTREHWDRVRFLSNAATGRLGIALAEALAACGHEAVLVLGPTHLGEPDDPAITTFPVVSARDMLAACEAAWPSCDALVATAAVADYRPAEAVEGKRVKSDGDASLALVPNPDVLATLTREKGARVAVGFALQVEDAEAHARRKLREKNLDAIVQDGPEAMGAGRATYRAYVRDGDETVWTDVTKPELAAQLVVLLEGLVGLDGSRASFA